MFASGQFLGPDTAIEFENLQAGAQAPEVPKTVLQMKAAGESISAIISWLQTLKQQPLTPGSDLFHRDYAGEVRKHAAVMLLQVYANCGESGFYSFAQRRANHQYIMPTR